jgi:hypothetical protein
MLLQLPQHVLVKMPCQSERMFALRPEPVYRVRCWTKPFLAVCSPHAIIANDETTHFVGDERLSLSMR